MSATEAGKPRARVALRLLVAHGVAYPVAMAWALGSVPALIVGLTGQSASMLEARDITHRVLLAVTWPALAAFLATHAVGLSWALRQDDRRGRRTFVVAMVVLVAVPVVAGGASWIWLMTR